MGQVLINEEYLQNTASAIRNKLHNNEKFTPNQFAEKINSIAEDITVHTKGLVIDEFDSSGIAKRVSLIGFTTLPRYYCYGIFNTNNVFSSVSDLYLDESIENIGEYCFSECKTLLKIVIPNKVTTLPTSCFYNCSKLATVVFPENLKTIKNGCFKNCNILKNLELPNGLESIETEAFYYNSSLTELILPESINSIGSYAFYSCSKVTTVHLPENLTSLNAYTFSNCLKLNDINIHDNLEIIDDYCFSSCSEMPLTRLPNNIKKIGYNAFQGCKKVFLTELPDSLEYIGQTPFTSITSNVSFSKLPANLTYIGTSAFENITVNFDSLPDKVETISSKAFYNNKGVTFNKLPESLKSLGSNAFYNCTNISINNIPKNITYLYEGTFQKCTGLTELTVHGNISAIANNCFNGCSNLTRIIFKGLKRVPSITSNVFTSTPIASKTGIVEVPHNYLDSIKKTTYWSSLNIIGLVLENLRIKNDKVNLYRGSEEIKVFYNDDLETEAIEEYSGYTLTISGNATLDGNIVTLTDNAKIGDIISITATSTYDPTITTTKELEVVYEEPSVNINLNDGQWVDSGERINDNIVYQSDSGSYHVNSGKSIATLTLKNVRTLKLYISSDGEKNYDYTEAFDIDVQASRSKGKYNSKSTQFGTYVECVYELDDDEHTIDIMYSKDSGGNTGNDRGYFYIGEYE